MNGFFSLLVFILGDYLNNCCSLIDWFHSSVVEIMRLVLAMCAMKTVCYRGY